MGTERHGSTSSRLSSQIGKELHAAKRTGKIGDSVPVGIEHGGTKARRREANRSASARARSRHREELLELEAEVTCFKLSGALMTCKHGFACQ